MERSHPGHYRLSMECMRILRTQDPITFQRLKDEYASNPVVHHVEEEPHHDDDINEFLDDWFQDDKEDHNPREKFLRDEALKYIYEGASLTRLSATLLILNLQARYHWSNASVSALFT